MCRYQCEVFHNDMLEQVLVVIPVFLDVSYIYRVCNISKITNFSMNTYLFRTPMGPTMFPFNCVSDLFGVVQQPTCALDVF